MNLASHASGEGDERVSEVVTLLPREAGEGRA